MGMRRLLVVVSIAIFLPQILLASALDNPDQVLLRIFDSQRPKLEKGWSRLDGSQPEDQVFKDYMGIVYYEKAPKDRNPIAQEIYYRSKRPDRLEVVILEYPRELTGERPSLLLGSGRTVFRRWQAVLTAPEGQAQRLIVGERSLKVLKEVATKKPYLLDYLVEYGRSAFVRTFGASDVQTGSRSLAKTALFFAGNPSETLTVPTQTAVSQTLSLANAASRVLSVNNLWVKMETRVGLRPMTGLLYGLLQRLAR